MSNVLLHRDSYKSCFRTSFDRYAVGQGIPEEQHPAAFALGLAEITGWPVPRFEKVEREEPADGVLIEGADI